MWKGWWWSASGSSEIPSYSLFFSSYSFPWVKELPNVQIQHYTPDGMTLLKDTKTQVKPSKWIHLAKARHLHAFIWIEVTNFYHRRVLIILNSTLGCESALTVKGRCKRLNESFSFSPFSFTHSTQKTDFFFLLFPSSNILFFLEQIVRAAVRRKVSWEEEKEEERKKKSKERKNFRQCKECVLRGRRSKKNSALKYFRSDR